MAAETRARAIAARARAGALQTTSAHLRGEAGEACDRSCMLGVRMGLGPRRTRGRIVARPHRRAAASERHTPTGALPGVRWAGARVFASRVLLCADHARGEMDPAPETWTVRELDAHGMPGARGARCLVFETAGCVRRVWNYPAAWATLPASALVRLASRSWR